MAMSRGEWGHRRICEASKLGIASQNRYCTAKTTLHKLPLNFGVSESWTVPFLIVSTCLIMSPTKDRTTTTARTINGSTSRTLRRVSLTSGWTDVVRDVCAGYIGGTYQSTEQWCMVVSWNRGAPKSSISMGFSIINHPFLGTPIYENPHVYIYIYTHTYIHAYTLDICIISPLWTLVVFSGLIYTS